MSSSPPTGHRWDRVKAILREALELEPDAREAFVQSACAGDVDLRSEVDDMLRVLDREYELMADPTFGATDVAESPIDQTGKVIGRYKLLEVIGEGGFGTVYMAEQQRPIQRRVALKVIKPGMDSKQVIGRFEAERQALAMMDHPNIARVLDAGATDEGRPYFVMELVEGVLITEYCDSECLPTHERLTLFVQVCRALQHAHQKGIIHRDLKPSNVMVTLHDGQAVPKIIDFGIAKAMNVRLTEKTMFTELRQLIGTPAYMSPEQAEMSGLDVDTRSDIYSLGVLLYELLTGTTPFDSERLRSASYQELQRIIREEEPDKPSTRLSSLGAVSGNGRHRRNDTAHLARSLRGDLDWVVMKCLEKDRSRRYGTANGLATDIQRHLRNEPVEAGPPNTAYRVRKFVRRNRVTVTAATMVVAALLVGTVGTTFGMVRAEQRERQTHQVSDFQAAMLSEIDVEAMARGIKDRFREQVKAALERQYVGEFPNRRKRTEEEVDAELAAFDQRAEAAQAVDVAREVMDEYVLARASDALEKQFADQPLVQARLRYAIGLAYHELAIYDAAEPHLQVALEIYRRVLGDDDPSTILVISRMGSLLLAQGKVAKAEPHCLEALEKSRRVLGDEDPHTLTAISEMASLLRMQGKLDDAERLCREALEAKRRVLGDEHPKTVRSVNDMGYVLMDRGQLTDAEPFFHEATEVNRRVLGDDDPRTLTSICNMGKLLTSLERFNDAKKYILEALEGWRRVLGEEHPLTLVSISDMGRLLKLQGKLAEAERYFREALEVSRRVLGDDHPETHAAIINMGHLLRDQDKLAEAEPHYREVLEWTRRNLDPAHPFSLASTYSMGRLLQDQDKLAEAEPYLREAMVRRRRVLGEEHPETFRSLDKTSRCLVELGKLEDALTLCRDFIEHLRARVPDGDRTLGLVIGSFGGLLIEQQAYEEAEPLLRECLQIRESTLHPDSVNYWLIAQTRSMLGCALAGRGAAAASSNPRQAIELFTEAEPLFLDGYEWLSSNFEQINPGIPRELRIKRVTEAGERIPWLYETWHAAEPDAGHDVRAAEWRAKLYDLPGP